MKLIQKYFPGLSDIQQSQLAMLPALYEDWNSKINVISRKDIDHLFERHVLHSMAIAKFVQFVPETTVLDVGTGGGFPGIPLAIMFPGTNFHLVDSIAKKIKVVAAVAKELNLQNVSYEQARAEELKGKYDFVISRAVTNIPQLHSWVSNLIAKKNNNNLKNGIIYIKGGDFLDELKSIKKKYSIYPISKFFEESFFETKAVVHIY